MSVNTEQTHLLVGAPHVNGVTKPVASEGSSDGSEIEMNQLGVVNGVFVPCLLNIMGVILFLRLAWAVGQAGWLSVMGMFVIAETQSIFTVLSLAAIVSNGAMRGGGSYFMISRNLGPELGGAVGTLFYSAYAMGTTFYVIGLATAIKETFFKNSEMAHLQLLIGSIGLFVVLLLALGGANFFTKINTLLFSIQFASIAIGILAIFARHAPFNLSHGGTFEGMSVSLLRDNASPGYTHDSGCKGSKCGFADVFAIIFPAATGIMEGANLSGDLRDPGKAIGKGTLYAVATSYVIYMLMVVQFGGAYHRSTLRDNTNVFQDTCWSEYIVLVGIIISTASSALGALFGGSRLLQAIAADDLFPVIGPFAKGSKKGNEPRRAVLFTWVVAQACLFIGDLDVVAPIISSFFCLSYAFTNLACFLMAVSGTINFRPRFKWFSWHTALIGTVLNMGVMFWLNFWYGAISVTAMIVIFIYLVFYAPPTEWGDVRQAIIFHQVRKYLLRLDERTKHGKLWRPSLLLFVDDLDSPLVGFCNSLKKGGVYIIGTCLVGPYERRYALCQQTRAAWLQLIDTRGLKAFPQVCTATTARRGYQSLLQTAGLGAMAPNTVVMPFIDGMASADDDALVGTGASRSGSDGSGDLVSAGDDGGQIYRSLTMYYNQSTAAMAREQYATSFMRTVVQDPLEYTGILRDIIREQKNLLLAVHFDLLNEDLVQDSTMMIDVWVTQEEATASWEAFAKESLFMLQMAHILTCKKRTQIRVLRIVDAASEVDADAERERIAGYIAESRIHVVEVQVVPINVPAIRPTSPGRGTGGPVPGDPQGGPITRDRSESRIHFETIDTNTSSQQRAEATGIAEVDTAVLEAYNSVIRSETTHNTYLCMLPMPTLPYLVGDVPQDTHLADAYIRNVEKLTSGLPATALVGTLEGKFMSLDI